MRVQDEPPIHLTYCLNVHRGETWAENLQALRDKTLRVRDAIAGGEPFGLGLRLSAHAAAELHHPDVLAEFRQFLEAEGLYVFTINGFPYGQFHDTAVKEAVYHPDWRCQRRLEYTNRLTDILAGLLPEGVAGSISTVPGSYKAWIRTREDLTTMTQTIAEAAAYMRFVRDHRGKEVCLALEPEPDCYLGSMDETLDFCRRPLMEIGTAYLMDEQGLDRGKAEKILRRHVGICFDAAHMAVEFEDLTAAMGRLREAGVPLAKVHLSSALRLTPTAQTLQRLEEFSEEVYLHQVRARSADGRLRSYPDLPAALRDADGATGEGEEWRVHFHVPLFFEAYQGLRSTTSLFTDEFVSSLRSGITQQIEIETYTFGVLPDALRPDDVVEGIAREYEWVMARLFAKTPPPRSAAQRAEQT